MAEIKMDLDVVTEFYTFMNKTKDDNVKINNDLLTAVNDVVGTTYIAAGAEQFDTFFREIFQELTTKLVTETDELIQQVKTEMEDFQRTGERLGR